MARLTVCIAVMMLLAPQPVEAQPIDPAPKSEPAVNAESEPKGPPPAQPEITPPRLLEFVEATYPKSAREAGLEAKVELEITIGPDGLVSDVKVISPAGNGFDEEALEAAKRFRFEPAKRGDTPVASRIRYGYIFEMREVAPLQTEQEAQAPSLGSMEGKVIDRDDEEPIEKVEVIISLNDGSVSRRTLTDNQGNFRFEQLPEGRYQVTAIVQQYSAFSAEEQIRSDEVTSVIYRLELATDPYAFSATARIPPPPREVTRRTINRQQLTRIAGTKGDPIRTVEVLPGVARPPFGSGLLIVRGSRPGDTQPLFEGLPVSLLYHFGGLTSFVNSRLLDSIDFYPGNFSVRYGRKQGGIVEVQAAEPEFERFHGVADINLVDASLFLEVPIVKDTGVVAAIRRSYIDFVFESLFSDDTFSVMAAPVYWDYQVMASSRVSSRDKLRLMAFGASDRFEILFEQPSGEQQEVTGGVDFSNLSHRVHATWNRRASASLDQDIELAAGTREFHFGFGREIDVLFKLVEIYGRAEWRYRLSRRVTVIGGLDLLSGPGEYSFYGPRPDRNQSGGPDGPLGNNTLELSDDFLYFYPAVYLESNLDLSPVRLVLGTRVDYFNNLQEFAFDPRLSAHYSLTPEVTLKAGVGLFTQPPEGQETVEEIGNPNLKPNRALHLSAGCEYQVVEEVSLGLEGYFKYLFEQVVPTAFGQEPYLVNDGIGRVYGVELAAKVEPSGRFFGYLSYTLSRSERRERDDSWAVFDFDQPHILTASGTYRLGRGWEAGLTFRLVSGNPYTPIVGSSYYSNEDRYIPIWGDQNSKRSRLFHRLDLRVEKLWTFDGWKLAVYLDVQNAYNAANQEGLIYDYRFRKSQVLTGLPILPVLGVRGEI
ncbi:MAG: TonB-dependent receptor [Deltaproteobacteria bacterium]|nr:TonB-dependent receptor [Deltaproteobacteria bacterium]